MIFLLDLNATAAKILNFAAVMVGAKASLVCPSGYAEDTMILFGAGPNR